MNSNFSTIPDLSFQDLFPNEAKLIFAASNETCRVQVKAGNLLFIIRPNGQQIAFSVENVEHKENFKEIRFVLKREGEFPDWPDTSTITLLKERDFSYEGKIVGEGLDETIRLDIQS